MKFDILAIAKCLTLPTAPPCAPQPPVGTPVPPIPCCEQEDFRLSNPTICLRQEDPRCSDPSFAAANPSICPNSARLILKPSYFLAEPLSQVTYQAFLLANGKETLLTSGVVFTSSNGNIAQIGGSTGKCSTVGPGICSISATWQGSTAYGQLEVIPSCRDHETDFVILIDDSKSMSQQFSQQFQSKLTFAKEMAKNFIDTIDLTKDKVAVFSFSAAAVIQSQLSQDPIAIKAAIQSIPPTTGTTDLTDSFDDVTAYLDLAGGNGTKVIVWFTDGENKTGGNPLPNTAAFEAGGNIILIVGCRAYDGGFMLLEAMASGGFFINALPSNQASVPDWLSGLKGYLCSGACLPPGDRTVNIGALDYTGFKNWNVSGHVDLLGNTDPDPKLGLYDFLPGNGLYVDMCGSSPPFIGGISTKAGKGPAIVAGTHYTLSFFLAGNQRENRSGDILSVNLKVNGIDQVNTTVTVDNWLQGFTGYYFAFTASQSGEGVITLATAANPGTPFYGLLLDVVDVTNTDASSNVFHDNFDTENPVHLPPNCKNNPPVTPGQPAQTPYGPCYASGCLDNPIPAQLPDPLPGVDVEDCSLTGGSTTNPFIPKGAVVGNVLGDSQGVLGDSQGFLAG